MSAKGRKKTPDKGRSEQLSDEVLLAEIGVRHAVVRTIRLAVGLGGLAIVVLAMWPVAHELAGKDTALNVSIALGLTASLTLAGGAALAWGKSQKRRADRLDGRNKQLTRDVKELQSRLRAADLPHQVSR